MKKLNINNLLKYFLIIIAICFTIPSIVFLVKNKTIFNFNGDLEFCFLLTKDLSRNFQARVYIVLIVIFICLYYFVLKKRKELFQSEKCVYKYIFCIAFIFVFVMPFWCSDIFYYLGIGRLGGYYHQNPYYTDIKSYFDNSNIDLVKDTLMQKGYNNFWSNTTVVYGPVWTIICSIVAILSFGNLDFGLLLFKIINLGIHMGNCYLLYKLSKKKIFPLMYGLNPFILIEGIANVHNDIFVVFFMLLSIFFLIKRKNLIISLLALALATDIKYFSILLLPLLIIYRYKDENVKKRFVKCIEYGVIFVLLVGIPYLFYIRDKNVFMGLVTQRDRIAKGLYLVISMKFQDNENIISNLKNFSLITFSICYAVNCIVLVINKNIKFYKEMRYIYNFVLVFLFFLLTNFQPWYFMWLSVFMIWQKSKDIKLLIQIQLLTLVANVEFLIYSENFEVGCDFFKIFVIGIFVCILLNNKKIKGLMRRK